MITPNIINMEFAKTQNVHVHFHLYFLRPFGGQLNNFNKRPARHSGTYRVISIFCFVPKQGKL